VITCAVNNISHPEIITSDIVFLIPEGRVLGIERKTADVRGRVLLGAEYANQDLEVYICAPEFKAGARGLINNEMNYNITVETVI